jgi:ABC-type iron transport system FetAB ATPase subunit
MAFLVAGPFTARNGEGRQLFSDLTVELAGGELVVLDGPSGSGKSTLLRQLVGLDPVEGVSRGLIDGEYTGTDLPSWRSKVTLMAQDAPMLAGTVGDNLEFPFAMRAAMGRLSGSDRRAELMAAVGLDGIPVDRDVATLSGGERHRLALVRGLLWDPPVLIADEPLSGLDDQRAAACFELLLDAAHRPDHAVLCVVHDQDLAHRADRRLRLADAALEQPS